MRTPKFKLRRLAQVWIDKPFQQPQRRPRGHLEGGNLFISLDREEPPGTILDATDESG